MTTQKRISAPKTYHIKRKQSTWVTSAKPGPHDKTALPLTVLLRDVLGVVRTAKEVKKILFEGKVLVDGRLRKDPRFPVGLMDVISIPSMKKYYRVIYDTNGRLKTIEINKKETGLKIVRVKGKKRLAKNYQVATNDGRSIIMSLSVGKKYSNGDSLLIKVPSQEVIKHLPFDAGKSAYIIGGKQVGHETKIVKIKEQYAKILTGKEEHRTIKDYLLITGDKKPELKLL